MNHSTESICYTVHGSRPFREKIAAAMDCALRSSYASLHKEDLPNRIFQSNIVAYFRVRRSRDLVLRYQCVTQPAEYIASFIVFFSVFEAGLRLGKEPKDAAFKAFQVQMNFAIEFSLDQDYIDHLECNIATMEIGLFPRLLSSHPAF